MEPIERRTATGLQSRTVDRASLPGQIVLVLQGGGALGSYQAGVYQALQEAGVEPDWIVGTSIGAINASLIAGNAPENRLARLIEFWRRVQRGSQLDFRGVLPGFGDKWSYWTTLTRGIPGFFTPNPLAHVGDFFPLGADHAGYYSTVPLEATLDEFVDFNLINSGSPRLTGRGGPRAHQQDDVFRQPRLQVACEAHFGVWCIATGIPCGARRWRAVLGRRHPVQHSHRGGV
jgi:NTE family protein